MPGDFEEVVSKFRWAGHHLAALNVAVADYIHQKPYVSMVKDKPEAQGYQVVARLRYPPPASIAHIAGDVLNSLHGTLDYLAWQLALREEGVPDLRTAFPIIKATEKDTTEPRVNIYRSGKGGRGTEPLIKDPAVLDLLRSVQPYNLPPAERHLSPLLLLRDLNGKSKHRKPAVITAAIDQGHYAYMTDRPFGTPTDLKVAMVTSNFAPLNDGDQMAWVPYTAIPEGGLPEHDDFATFVALEEAPVYPRTGKPFPISEALADLTIFIDNNVLVPFAPLFGVTPPS